MNAAAAAFAVLPALALGSFLNVVVARVPERRSLVRPRSSCGSCGSVIEWWDNIPLLSYVVLRGRCRRCGVRISPVYPLVEALTAVLVAVSVAVFGPTLEGALAAGFCAVLVALSVIDARDRIVPDRIVLPAAGTALVLHTAADPSLEWLLAALVAAGALFAVVLAYPRGLGLGDVKLALLLGAVLGTTVAVALMVGFFAALVPAAVLVKRHGASARKMGVPLVPFLSFGAVTALFFGERILDGYLGLF